MPKNQIIEKKNPFNTIFFIGLGSISINSQNTSIFTITGVWIREKYRCYANHAKTEKNVNVMGMFLWHGGVSIVFETRIKL